MKTQLLFKLEKNPEGFNKTIAADCKVKIEKTEGIMYLNYENRPERAVGRYANLRQEGENILADVELFEKLKPIEERIEYSIDGAVVKTNEKEEANSIRIKGVAALMHNKF